VQYTKKRMHKTRMVTETQAPLRPPTENRQHNRGRQRGAKEEQRGRSKARGEETERGRETKARSREPAAVRILKMQPTDQPKKTYARTAALPAAAPPPPCCCCCAAPATAAAARRSEIPARPPDSAASRCPSAPHSEPEKARRVQRVAVTVPATWSIFPSSSLRPMALMIQGWTWGVGGVGVGRWGVVRAGR
jgi:hypothetical protein